MSTNPNPVDGASEAAKTAQARAASKPDPAKAKADAIKAAIEILRGTERSADEILELANQLKKRDEFGYAWRILAKARALPGVRNHPRYLEIVQKSALNTYKDVNLPLEKRLDDALKILADEASLEKSKDKETRGLAGAIYKRKWEADNRRESLEQSLFHYEKGYREEPEKEYADLGYTAVNADQGYTAINAAYVSDLLGEKTADVAPAVAKQHRAAARAIREMIVAEVPRLIEPPLIDAPPMAANIRSNAEFKGYWFFYSTVGEAYFGLGDYDRALKWLVERPQQAGAEPGEWEFETTARQLASLARLQIAAAPTAGKAFEQETPWLKFREFLDSSEWSGPGGVSSEAVRRGFEGKIGLGLSGGGFRASLFHIGVLARLAELDVLRGVEVISCVSGGSIVGAHYYLEVQDLLRRKRDDEIGPDDYIEIVQRLEERFVAGVQRNIRMRVAASLSAAFKMVFKPGYTRTLRLGELYEEELFTKVDDRLGEDKKKPRFMHELIIHPLLGEQKWWDEFKPKFHNWRRRAKAPILVLNAATLNTGHNWQFTATYMGESPAAIHTEIDIVYRLRRKSYTDEPNSQQQPQAVRLGAAVAASSCVPALFEPIMLESIYERPNGGGGDREVSVRLVDGGVCDNQGVASLLEQDCNVLLVSDGSGQIESLDAPGTAALSVGMRSNSMLQARIRGTQYRELDARHRTSLLRELMFVHLKKDLDNTPVDWKGCPAHLRIASRDVTEDMTGYGIPKDIQQRLARIRTDLDTFCDIESFALMTSGYRMTVSEYQKTMGRQHKSGEPKTTGKPPAAVDWNFLRVEEVMKNTNNDFRDERRYLEEVLDAGSKLPLKVWKLSPGLKTLSKVVVWLATLLGLAALVGIVALIVVVWIYPAWWNALVFSPERLRRAGELITFGLIASALVAAVAAALLVYLVGRAAGVTSWMDTLARKVVAVLLLFVGYPASKIHLWFFDRKYKECGGIDRIVRP